MAIFRYFKIMKKILFKIQQAYSAHYGLTHWAVSYRIFGHGDFFHRLMKKDQSSCTIRTFDRAVSWFSDSWPENLAWPDDIPRPSKKEDAA